MVQSKFTKTHFTALLLLLLLVLAACAGSAGENSAAGAVEAYLGALAGKDADRLSTLSCSAWEAEARNELESFGAVSVTQENVSCQESGEAGDYTVVACSGALKADYNGEILEIDLSERTFQAINEGGEWRMCGYP